MPKPEQELKAIDQALDAKLRQQEGLRESFSFVAEVQIWERFIAGSVESGLCPVWDDYLNSVHRRDTLEAVLGLLPPALATLGAAALAPLDKRYLAATELIPQGKAFIEGAATSTPWWYRRLPVTLPPTNREQLLSLMYPRD